MNHYLITQTELSEMFGYSSQARLLECLRKQGVPVFIGKGGQICTTLDALNFALGLRVDNGIKEAKQIVEL